MQASWKLFEDWSQLIFSKHFFPYRRSRFSNAGMSSAARFLQLHQHTVALPRVVT